MDAYHETFEHDRTETGQRPRRSQASRGSFGRKPPTKAVPPSRVNGKDGGVQKTSASLSQGRYGWLTKKPVDLAQKREKWRYKHLHPKTHDRTIPRVSPSHLHTPDNAYQTPRGFWHDFLGTRVFHLAESRHGTTAGTHQEALGSRDARKSKKEVDQRSLFGAGPAIHIRDSWPASCVSPTQHRSVERYNRDLTCATKKRAILLRYCYRVLG